MHAGGEKIGSELSRDSSLHTSVHPSVVLGEDVVLADGVVLGPGCVIGDRVSIGAGTTVHAGVCIGDDVETGSACELGHGCVILAGSRLGHRVSIGPSAVLGADGFGFVESGGVHHKIPQVGTVVLGDDVVIGAGACVDRATTGETVLGQATRVGPLVQIGHNVRFGSRCVIGAQAGVAGSCVFGDDVTLGDQVGTIPHVRVGSGVVAGRRTGFTKSVPAGIQVDGYPVRPREEHLWLLEQIDGLVSLTARLDRLEHALDSEGTP